MCGFLFQKVRSLIPSFNPIFVSSAPPKNWMSWAAPALPTNEQGKYIGLSPRTPEQVISPAVFPELQIDLGEVFRE